ncbi:MAG: tRNA (cytidine(56)-2'-O)-methyltransferase [Euryarchaeota archaeon]|nr:tRNA (cytidine(56)-2'-O)-methyltransferase [Euryarchaeota archaeon]MBV1729675.1 tRNA (cytidine(56)-2'-O)-methyltransferase [Methanobacterium sp.]MBU4548300.1 tRNA (cytidine(56)-2'-O)-methyltransferase [Euryarchaeota archaeon]MBU4607508.1 tRNA (cytidine(56)-2'-O)-methyltransferase [Euryarchaeota archaeon]MBV1754450.1 tRNA (cytidine(56)-2'-O)-methyltransferase [Methanobacterium sp.]
MNISILRLDHRRRRDARITTHVCLTARAFGASDIILSGEKDQKLMENVKDVVKRWGGSFSINYKKNWDNFMEEWQSQGGEIIHLTMYGSPVQEVVKDIQKTGKKKLVVVGGSRVPSKVYKSANWNVSITNQPHSEVSSLGVFLHMLMDGKEFDLEFEGADLEVIPQAEGKEVLSKKKDP